MIHRTRLHFDRDYTIMPNAWARDVRLSRKARGLLAELLSHSPGWTVTIQTLVASGREGREAVRSTVLELEAAGYLVRSQRRGQAGQFQNVDYELCDPMSENPTSVSPSTKKTIAQKTIQREEVGIRSLAQRSTDRDRFASDSQKAYLRDLIIHETGEKPTAEDEQWIEALTARDAWSATRDMLSAMPRYDEYQGPDEGTPPYEALSDTGKRAADLSMVPEAAR